MLSGTITNRYTRGLYEAAQKQGLVDAVDASLKVLADALQQHALLKDFIEHPLIGPQEKLQALEKVFGEALHPFVLRFLNVLLTRGRSQYIRAIYEKFHDMAESAKGQVAVKVETALPLTPEQTQALAEKIGSALGRQVTAAVEVRPELIAGCRIFLKNRVLDATVRSALDQFRQQLTGAARHKA